jgi:hypothetical protein
MRYGLESSRTDNTEFVPHFLRGGELVRLPKGHIFDTADSEAVIIITGLFKLFSKLLDPMFSQLPQPLRSSSFFYNFTHLLPQVSERIDPPFPQ